VIPSIALKRGTAFFIYSRGETEERSKYPEKGPDLEDEVEALGERYGCVHILDLDGMEKGHPNYNLISDLSSVSTVWLECGSGDTGGVMDALMTGAEYVIIGTRFLPGMDELEKIFELTENLFLGVEWDGRILSPDSTIQRMTPGELAMNAKKIGIARVIFTDAERIKERTRSINYVAITDMIRQGMEVYASGGCTMEDRGVLERLKARGMILDAGIVTKSGGQGVAL